ncbi:MAG: hypothetical protein JWQ15_757 [Marmoricola sp.]|jgi:hypothetical protein|nr:hypothetical protein [Marmoricola sp.]
MPEPEQSAEAEATPGQPLLRIVKGDPTPEETAALVTVVAAMAAETGDRSSKPRRPEWSAHHRKLRGVHRHGPGAWRAGAR